MKFVDDDDDDDDDDDVHVYVTYGSLYNVLFIVCLARGLII